MVEFKVGDRVIVRWGELAKVGRVVGLPRGFGACVNVRISSVYIDPACNWILRPDELTLAPSRRADLSPDDNQAVHCYCAKESPLGSYTSSEGHYQEEDE